MKYLFFIGLLPFITLASEKPQDLQQSAIIQNELEKSTDLQSETPLDTKTAAEFKAQKTILAYLISCNSIHKQHIDAREVLQKQLLGSSQLDLTIDLQGKLLQNKNAQLDNFKYINTLLGYKELSFLKPIAEKYNPVMKPEDWLKNRSKKEIDYIVEKLGIEDEVKLPL